MVRANTAVAKQAPGPLHLEDDQLRLLPEVHRVLFRRAALKESLADLVQLLSRHIHLNCACVTVFDPASGQLRLFLQCAPGATGDMLPENFVVSLDGSPCGEAFTSGKPVVLERISLKRYPSEYTRRMTELGLQSGCSIPLITPHATLGALCLGSMKVSAFRPKDMALLTYLAQEVALVLENQLATKALQDLKRKLSAEIAATELQQQRTGPSPQTLREVERDHIMAVLQETHGVLGGPSGAAARLGLKRTTLQYKMQRLGIDRQQY
jgi:transcriptional regulator with GAF, ATPase, and Fis domain